MKKIHIRVVKEFDFNDVANHLLVVGDLKGDCFHCREIGLDYVTVKKCPQCGQEFRYIASRQSRASDIRRMAILSEKRPDLVCVELDDVLHYKNREKAKELFA